MEFPNEIKEYILSYLSPPYKKPLHLDVIKTSKEYRIHIYKKPLHFHAIKRSHLFVDFRFNRMFFLDTEKEIEKSVHSIWMDSVMEYKIFSNNIKLFRE